MTDLQRVVDELRFLMQRQAIEQSDELTSLLDAYSKYCHDVNLRLRQCDERIKQGLLSEALHLAEVSPNLLDAVAILDFPEREQFLDVISMYFLTPPEPVLLDVAAVLNEAYAQHEPLQKLLDSQRLLVLARSPLRQRLTVLRSLAQLDESTPHWEADVREMERARIQELSAEARAAAKQRDTATLKSLLDEVQSGGWYETIPAPLLRELKSFSSQIQRGNARQRIEELGDELYAAFSELDAPRARSLREEWNRKQQAAQIPKDDPVREHVAPVFDWLIDEDRKLESEQAYVRAVANIEGSLEKDELTSAELRRLGLAVDRLERSLPGSLESRYRNRLAAVELNEARGRRLVIGGSAAAFAAAVGLFGFIVYWSVQAEQTRRIASAVEVLLDEGKLPQARKLVEQQPLQANSEAWLNVQKKLLDAEQAESDRVKRWQAEIETARQSVDAVQIEAALKVARELSRTTDEKIEVGKLQSNWQQRVREETAARERQFRVMIELAGNSLQLLDAALSHDDQREKKEWQSLLDDAESQLAKLQVSRGNVAAELTSQADLLNSRLTASRKTIADLTRKSGLLDKLTEAALILPVDSQSISKAGNYENALREYATSLPNDPRAATFNAMAESSPLPSVLARQKLVNRWKRLRPVDEKDAETRVREIRSFLTEHPASPDRETIGKYETWLASILRRFSDDGDPDEGVLRRTAALFNSKFIKDGYVLRDVEGHSYYLVEPTKGSFGSIATFKYYVGFNGETRSKSINPQDLVMQTTEPPPQAEIAVKVKTSIRDLRLDNWRDYFRDLTESLLKANRIDPFLRYVLVLKTLEFASLGDACLEQELASVLEKLSDDDLDRSVAWMNPENESANRSRKEAARLLEALGPLEPLFARAGKRQEEFEREVFASRFPVGWLDRLPRGDWVCRTKWFPPREHVLHVVTRADASGPQRWSVLGRIQGTSITVDSTVAQSVGEAAVVFASAVTTEAKTVQLP